MEDTTAPTVASASSDVIRLWAASATASSSYGSTDWSADQALGAPNTNSCGDHITAWASKNNDTVEWLELGYAVPLYVKELIVYQSYNPVQIINIELIEPNGSAHSVYTGTPREITSGCPHKLILSWENPQNYPTENVRITVDQTVLGLGWAEIDAVQLSGIQVLDLYANDDPATGDLDDDLPVPPGAEIILSVEETVTYNTNMSLEALQAFYRENLTKKGYKENKLLSLDFKGGFSMVFDGSAKGQTIIQASEIGDGKVVVVIRHE